MIPVIYGWGKYSKKIADIGLTECSNCKNIVGAELHQINKGVKLYFIQVAKWDKHFFVVCPICNAGFEINIENKEKILKKSVKLPDNRTSISIWNDLMDELNTNSEGFFKEERKTTLIKQLLTKGYKKDDIEYVYSYLVLHLLKRLSNQKKS